MVEYTKLKFKKKEDLDEIDVDDMLSLNNFGDISFRFISGIAFKYVLEEDELRHKATELSKDVDWVIKEYNDKLYLIALKKRKY